MFDAIATDVSVGLALVVVAAVLVAASAIRRHPIGLLGASVAIAGGYLLDVRGADVAVDLLGALAARVAEALLRLSRVVDALLAAAFDRVSGIWGTDVGIPSPEVGVPGAVPSPGFLQAVATVLVTCLLAGIVLAWLANDAADSPLDAWLGGVGIAFGVVGVLWTAVQSNAFDLSTGGAVAAVAAAPVGLVFGVLATWLVLEPGREGSEHAGGIEGRYPTVRRTHERDANAGTEAGAGSGGGGGGGSGNP